MLGKTTTKTTTKTTAGESCVVCEQVKGIGDTPIYDFHL